MVGELDCMNVGY